MTTTTPIPVEAFASTVARALDEDLAGAGDPAGPGPYRDPAGPRPYGDPAGPGPYGDPTSRALGAARGKAAVVARRGGTVAGLPAVALTLDAVAARLGTGAAAVTLLVADGDAVGPAATLAVLDGPVRTLLAAERTVLNLVGRLSGVATMTASFVAAVAGTGATVRDTRKTTPGLRALEKYAVRCGGGVNHRQGLYDALLVKDNHIAAAGGLAAAVAGARDAAPDLPLEVEVDTLDQVTAALDLGCDLLLLDNMSIAELEAAVRLAAGRARTEASGGITIASARAVAATGVDYVSVGAITHSAPALDVALDWRG